MKQDKVPAASSTAHDFALTEEQRRYLRDRLAHVRRLVVKVGTRVIDHPETRFNSPVAVDLAHDIADLRNAGVEVILVSSGAIGLGMRLREENRRPRRLARRQAYAAIGQSELMHQYRGIFRIYGIPVAQVLLTRRDLDDRTSYVNAREALSELLKLGVLPIINENDTVAVDELRFSDNDMLAALLAGKMEADLLVVLTVVDGLYTRSPTPVPGRVQEGQLVPYVLPEDDEILSHAKESDSYRSLGGMRAKIEAARLAARAGLLVAIANGTRPRILSSLWHLKAPATWMVPTRPRVAGRKHWIAFGKKPSGGRIRIDSGALTAISDHGKSLLARGVTAVTGRFERGDLVEVEDESGRVVARGLTHYSSTDLERIRRKTSNEIRKILGPNNPPEVIHRDDLAVL